MNRKNQRTPKPARPDEHLEALGPLLTQLKTHLVKSAEKKGTYSDYLRLLEFYRETREGKTRQILVGWVENETAGRKPLP